MPELIGDEDVNEQDKDFSKYIDEFPVVSFFLEALV